MPSRIGTQALFMSQLSYLQRLQTQQNLTNEQIATGFKSPTFAGVAKDSGSIISAQSMMAKIDQYNQNITIATNRSKLMDTSLSSIDKSISTLQGYISQLANATTPPDVPKLAKDLLNQVTDYLNLNDGSRYLFAGSNTQTAPVKTLSYTAGVSPTVSAVPATLTRGASVLPLASTSVFPAANFDSATNTYFIPDPDNPAQLRQYKADLPPLQTIEFVQQAGDALPEPGRVIEGLDGARARIMYTTQSSPAADRTVRAYIEPLNEIPFRTNDTLSMKQLELVGGNYVETTTTAGGTYTAIGGVRDANIDTQSIQLSGALPTTIAPGSILEIGGAGNRFIVQKIETGSNPVLQVRPLGTSTLTATNTGAGAGRMISVVNQQTGAVTAGAAQMLAGADGIEHIGRPADYQTNGGTTSYYTNSNAAREVLNPQKTQVSDTSTVDYGVGADQSGFARLIYTLNFLQQQSSPLNSDDVTAATKILAQARTEVTSIRASLGINQKTLAGIQEENTLQKSIANNNFDSLAKQDRTEAIATLTSLQTTLEASYQSFVRVQDLNLQSFLR